MRQALAVDGVVIEERRLKAFVQFETFEVSRWALMNVGRLMRNGVGVDDVWELDLIPERIVKDVKETRLMVVDHPTGHG